MENKDKHDSFAGFFIRLYWMAFGHLITILLVIRMAVKNPESIMLLNIFYFLNTACLVISRYVDIQYLNGLTTEYEPATIKDWKEYSVKLIIISLLLWIIVYFTKNYTSSYLGLNK